MSYKAILGALTVLVIALSVAYIWFLTDVTQTRVAALFPAVSGDVSTLLLVEGVALFLFGLVVSIAMFFVQLRLIVRPLRAITTAIEAFIDTGARMDLPEFRGAPAEIQTLRSALYNFSSKVEEAHARDVEISRVKSDFISTAAHQLRTPLTGVRWALEALEKEKLTESQRALVKSAMDKSRDLGGIVGTLLDISSIESGKYRYTFAPLDIREVLESVAHDLAQLAASEQVSVLFARDEAEIPKVRADKERIKWVIMNLVENAIQYTPAGGSVRLYTEQVPGRVLVKVRDTGIGIEPQDRNNIFERFYRASNAVTKQNKGNGLGLYIARTIATDHGGDLDFEANADGPGTVFTLALPSVE